MLESLSTRVHSRIPDVACKIVRTARQWPSGMSFRIAPPPGALGYQ
jgi:hypothetical protein